MGRTLDVAVIQMRSSGDPQRNIEWLEQAIGEAAAKGAQYIQTPEMTGAVQRDRAKLRAVLRGQDDDEDAAMGARLAARHGIHLHIGSTAIARDDGKIANRAFLFAPDGSLVTTYDKIHMFDVDLDNGESWRESAVYVPGNQAVIAPVAGVNFGLAICYDLRFPQLFQAQAMAGAQMLTCHAAFTRQTGEAHWHALLRARAIENGAFVIAAAQGGKHEDGRETYGHSLVIDPWGVTIGELDHDEPGVLICDIDVERAKAARAKIPNLVNRREFSGPGSADAKRGAA